MKETIYSLVFRWSSAIFFLLVLSINSFAQSNNIHIGGQVSDSLTNMLLPGVTIYITDKSNGRTDSTYTNTSGQWSYNLSTTSIGEDETLPGRFSVSQNYPNPFNPSTRVDINLPEAGSVKAEIYNAIGESIESHEEYLGRGAYTIVWNARGNAGVYFLCIKARSGSITRKMVLLDRVSGTGLSAFKPGSVMRYSANNKAGKISAQIPVTIQTSKFGYLPRVENIVVSGGEYFNFKIETVHSSSTLVDLHNDILEKMVKEPAYHLSDEHSNDRYHHTDIPRLKTGGVDVQFFAVWVDPDEIRSDSSYDQALSMINIFKSEIAQNPASIGQAFTKKDAEDLNKSGKIAAVIGVEGGHAIENDIEKLKALYREGMRYLTITWNNSTDWAISAQDSRSSTVGLSEFGRQVIRTLDSLGVIIDVSHTGIKTIEDILSITKNPVIATHSGARALRNHTRNLDSTQIKAIAKSGGVVGIVFYPTFLTSSRDAATVSTVANHIDYIVKLVGIDYVAIGSDFDGIGTNTVIGLEDTSKFPALTLELLRRGYSTADIRKILGGNFLRVFEKVCGGSYFSL